MSLPVISNQAQLLQYLQKWRSQLSSATKKSRVPAIPWNFQIKTQQGGNLLNWAAVVGADGYQILRSDTGDFADGAFITIPVQNGLQTSYFDAVSGSGGAAPAKKYYKIRATSGTTANPQSVLGLPSGVISAAAIAANDAVTASVSAIDNTTDDESQSFTRYIA